MNELVSEERSELQQFEQTIEQGLKTFAEVGSALLAIRDKRLYREQWGTFEEYCRDRWGFKRSYAYEIMEAAATVKTIEMSGIPDISMPSTVSQARPLATLSPEAKTVVWQKAVETAPNGKPTAAHVEATARSMYPSSKAVELPSNATRLTLQPPVARTFVAPVPPPVAQPVNEVVRSEVRFVPALPIRDGEEFDDMVEEAEEDGDGYDWTEDEDGEEEDYSEFDTVTITDVSGTEETITVPGGISGVTEALEISDEFKKNGMAIHFSSESPEHYTPKEIIDAAIAVMGAIDLDPCSNSKDAPNVPALECYTVDDDGLSMPWLGRVYMNPPYGRTTKTEPGITAWTEKLATEYEAGNVTEAIALVPGRIDTQWWQMLGKDYHACFVTGRLTFIGNDDPAPFPSTVFYLGENVAKFFEVFSAIGQIWKRIDEHWFTD